MTATSPPPVLGTGRLLAAGDHADVHEWADGAQEHRVVKIHRGPAQRRSALSEAAVLAALDHPHVVPLLDVRETPTGLGLVLPRLESASAETLLRERRILSAGETVTLVVPVLRALLHLQRRRFHPDVHLAATVNWGNVLFDDCGAPLVTSVRPSAAAGIALLHAPTSVDDAARRLVREALDATVGGDEATRQLVDRLLAERASLDELIEAVFDLEAAVPLERPVVDSTVSEEAGARAVLDAHPLEEAGRIGAAARARATLRQVRPRVWLTSGVVVSSAALAAIALDAGTGAGTATGTSPSGDPITVESDPPSASQQAVGTTPLAVGEKTLGATSTASAAPETADVAAVTHVLLAHREECLRELDAACLTEVDRAGSPLLARDQAAVAEPYTVSTRRAGVDLGEPRRASDVSVLFDATARAPGAIGGDDEPASVLVEGTEAGWRLSDVS